MKKQSKTIALCSIITALTFVFSYFPFVFLIPLILTAGIQRLRLTLFSAFVFGIISFLLSFSGGSVVALAFVSNPLIPIVPRLFVGLITHYVFKSMFKLTKNRYFSSVISAAAASISNSVLVITALVLFTPSIAYNDVSVLAFVPVMIMFGCIELAVNMITVPPISLAVFKSKVLNEYYFDVVKDKHRLSTCEEIARADIAEQISEHTTNTEAEKEL